MSLKVDWKQSMTELVGVYTFPAWSYSNDTENLYATCMQQAGADQGLQGAEESWVSCEVAGAGGVLGGGRGWRGQARDDDGPVGARGPV